MKKPAPQRPTRTKSKDVCWRPSGFWITFHEGFLQRRVAGYGLHDSSFRFHSRPDVAFHPSALGPYELTHEHQNFINALMLADHVDEHGRLLEHATKQEIAA